jgi:hypothetical protein
VGEEDNWDLNLSIPQAAVIRNKLVTQQTYATLLWKDYGTPDSLSYV